MAKVSLQRAFIVAAALGSPGAVAVLYCVDPSRQTVFPPCILHEFTGLHCPFCGGTRAVHSALTGDFAQATAWHPFALLVAAGLLAWLWWAAVAVCRGRPIPQLGPPNRVMRWVLVFLIAFAVLRNLPFYPFDQLAPHVLE